MSIIHLSWSNIYPLVSLIFIIFLGTSIFLKNVKATINRLFFAITIVFAIWEFGTFMMFLCSSDNWILFWDRFVYIGVVFVPAIQYHFSLAATEYNNKRKVLLFIAYALSLVFLLLSRTPYFVDGVFHYRWGSHTEARLGHHFFLVYFFFYIFAFLYNFFKKFRITKNKVKRLQMAYYIIAFSVLNLIGGLAYLPAYKIAVYPIALISPIIFSILIAYAIAYYSLMNIKVILRKSLVYFLLITFIAVPAGIWLYVFSAIIPDRLILISLGIIIISLTAVSELKREFYALANKYFFSSLYDAKETIYNINKALHASLDIKKTHQDIAAIIDTSFRPQAIAFLSHDPDRNRWKILYNKSFRLREKQLPFLDYRTMTALFRKNRPLIMETLEEKLAGANHSLLKHLKALKVEIIVPIKMNDGLEGIMIMGAKQSRDEYSLDDLKLLTTIGAEISLAMENIRLYEKEKKFNSRLVAEINKATRQIQAQNKELKRLDAAKNEFVSIVSHQLRTPLTGIRWFTNLLLGNKKKNLNEEQLDFLSQINTSNRRMIKLVNDLLDVSHIETGYKFKVTKRSFALLPLIEEVLEENILTIRVKELAIDNLIPKNLKVCADRSKIRQVWQNLISNATAYSPSGQSITIDVQTEDGRQIFSIKDEGIGIPKRQQQRIFEKFFRAKNASSQDANGTGLGLYIAKEIIVKHGGEMWFKSVENKGTTFFFSLPEKAGPKKDN